MTFIHELDALGTRRFETTPILRKLASACRQPAERKGVAGTIPNQGILVNTRGMREAKDSSAIENIVTTDDELFQEDVFSGDDKQRRCEGSATVPPALRRHRAPEMPRGSGSEAS